LAHFVGNKPYDKAIYPAENKIVAFLALGEGWHNYHHAFPWDYKAAELGDYSLNWATAFIDFFAKIGWAYDLKTVSRDVIEHRVKRTGDGSHPLWGWNDKDQTWENKKMATIVNIKKKQLKN
jgi:stearoyl-CoA desaturase (delta-9 desaturase)